MNFHGVQREVFADIAAAHEAAQHLVAPAIAAEIVLPLPTWWVANPLLQMDISVSPQLWCLNAYSRFPVLADSPPQTPPKAQRQFCRLAHTMRRWHSCRHAEETAISDWPDG